MFRISITYSARLGGPFNWEYYISNHLPLAVGTSMRHSGLNFCDADKALNEDSPYVCVCMVHFDSEDSMINFCNFFVKEHPESERIDNDEKNYTTIPPNMVAAECENFDLVEQAEPAAYRIKLFFPYTETSEFWREKVTAEIKQLLEEQCALEAGVVSTELDFCTSGIVPGSEPDNSFIWAICFNGREEAEKFKARLQTVESQGHLKDLMLGQPDIMISEIMHFDMALTEPYRNA
jgi:hypothetical protein